MAELNYEFRKRMMEVHTKSRRMEGKLPAANQVEITSEWEIVIPEGNDFLRRCARDLEDYFLTSMGVQVRYNVKKSSAKNIEYVIDETLSQDGSYIFDVTDSAVRITGKDERAVAQGSYYLEDLMNIEEAPFLDKGSITRAPRFRTRMVHSGYSIDNFPDEHLNAIAHSGINSILVFTKDVNLTTCGFIDFNDLIYRASRYGVDVYAYSYYKNKMHPSDEGGEEYYRNQYGKLFKMCPGLKGIVFVGESIEFPSHDERTTGRPWRESFDKDGKRITNKPAPGWYPCNDYPEWVNMIKKVVREENPAADIVFWTYNWGYVEEEKRVELINNLPTDISLQATFEMFEQVQRIGVNAITTDYSIFEPGPGKYFASEAKAAKKRGIPLYSMTNAGGLTWDIGTIPYEPTPYQWLKRYNAMIEMNENYGLVGSMDSHHFGFYPSFISELAKWCFWTPTPSGEEVIDTLAGRDWGKQHIKAVTDAYKLFSEGINLLISTNQDQYGPLRIGSSYPLVLFDDEDIVIPSPDYAHFGGNKICSPNYMYNISTPEKLEKFNNEIMLYTKSSELFLEGAKILTDLLPEVAECKRDNARRIAGLGEFMGRAIATARNVKEWHKRKVSLLDENADVDKLLDEMTEIAKFEIENAKGAIPLVEFDSRLGYEPSMEYMCDKAHLDWKIGVVQRIIDEEIPKRRASREFGKLNTVSIFSGGRADGKDA